MPVLIRGDKAVLFIHIPKTGGSSFERDMANLGWREVFSIRGMPASRLKFIKASPQHFSAELMEGLFNFEEFSSVVCIIRDPFDRLKSAFYYHFRSQVGRFPPDVPTWIQNTLSATRHNPYHLDNHIRPQVDFLPPGVDCELFKLEEDGVRQAQIAACGKYEKQPRKLMHLLGIRNEEREKISKYDPDIEEAFSSQRSTIADFYAADYAAFGYDPAGSFKA
ncbi:sulfotransferase family protein [Pontimonas sp.]|nr:sulfotransferase family 2 domain-containing protein [Pontimonas sp.]MDA8909483.1 sulfotransferase family protein [Pontimonas sp.]